MLKASNNYAGYDDIAYAIDSFEYKTSYLDRFRIT